MFGKEKNKFTISDYIENKCNSILFILKKTSILKNEMRWIHVYFTAYRIKRKILF